MKEEGTGKMKKGKRERQKKKKGQENVKDETRGKLWSRRRVASAPSHRHCVGTAKDSMGT